MSRSSRTPEIPSIQGNVPRRKTRGTRSTSHHACLACKARKVRCDASRPICSYCAARDISCVYLPAFKRASCSQAHVAALERRVIELESRHGIPSNVASAANTQRNASPSPLGQQLTATASVVGSLRPPHSCLQQTEEVESLQRYLPQEQLHLPLLPRPGTPAYDLESAYKVTALDEDFLDRHVSHEQQASDEMRHEHDDIEMSHNLQEASGSDVAADRNEDAPGSDNNRDRADDVPIVDGMVEYLDVSPDAGEGDAFYGNTSTLHFARDVIASAVDENGRGLAQTARGFKNESMGARQESVAVPTKTAPRPPTNQAQNVEKVSLSGLYVQYLPHRHIANALLERYFTAVHPIWPFLLEEATRKRYEDTWSADGQESEMWSAQLSLMFALGFEFWEDDLTSRLPSRPAINAGNEIYQRARVFVLDNAFNTSSISMVQALLLMVQYQQGTMQSEQCWLTIGHATRMAQGLGLHKPEKQDNSISLVERELRNRLWWGCFSLDRVSSMVYGRPTSIHQSHAARKQYIFPRAVDDQHTSLGQNQPNNVPSLYAFFHHVVKMYCVVDDVLELVYEVIGAGKRDPEYSDWPACHKDISQRSRSPSIQTAIVQIDYSLLDWHDSLPEFLNFSINTPTSDDRQPVIIQRQRNILRCRFLGVRMLLHRQTLLHLLQPPERRQWLQDENQGAFPRGLRHTDAECGLRSPFESSFAHVSARTCVYSAELLIEAISQGRPLGLAGAWWWDFYFTFNSLCVIFAAMSLQIADLEAVIPNTARTMSLVQCGFDTIRAMAAVGGPKTIQSEKFLKRLMAATVRGAKKRSHMDITGVEVHAETPCRQGVNTASVTCQPSPPSESQNQLSHGIGDNATEALHTVEPTDSLLPFSSNTSIWENTLVDYTYGSPDLNSIETMLQGSFDVWDTLDNLPGLV